MTTKFKLVNWTDGMAINSENLRQTENYFTESISDTLFSTRTNYNYGLLPLKSDDEDSGIRIREHITDHIELSIDRCNAITKAGVRIKFNLDAKDEPLVKTYSPQSDPNNKDKNHSHWDVILTVQPYERKPMGALNLNEMPFRHPDTVESYTLSVVPKGVLNIEKEGIYSLVIGRIRKDGVRYVADSNYIPPCVNMISHPDLAAYYRTFADCFQSMDNAARNVVTKIQNGSNSSVLALNINGLCKDIMQYIGAIYFKYKNMGRYMSPVEVVDFVSTFSHICYVNLLCLSGKNKDELLKYFYEWSDVSPGSFEEILSAALEINYEHGDIRAVMVQSEQVLVMMEELLNRLSRLEFIGQHKENIIVSERGGQNDGSSQKGWVIE